MCFSCSDLFSTTSASLGLARSSWLPLFQGADAGQTVSTRCPNHLNDMFPTTCRTLLECQWFLTTMRLGSRVVEHAQNGSLARQLRDMLNVSVFERNMPMGSPLPTLTSLPNTIGKAPQDEVHNKHSSPISQGVGEADKWRLAAGQVDIWPGFASGNGVVAAMDGSASGGKSGTPSSPGWIREMGSSRGGP